MLNKLLNRRRKSKLKARRRRALQVEPLETRRVMASYVSGGELIVFGHNGDDDVTVSQVSSCSLAEPCDGPMPASQILVEEAAAQRRFNMSQIPTGLVRFYGNRGIDRFTNTSVLRVWADGGPDNDVITGGNSDDRLYGGEAADTLIGGAGHDSL